MKLAVIDICGTLYDSNTTIDFIRWYSRKNKTSFLVSLVDTWGFKFLNKVLYRLFKLDMIRYIKVRKLKGLSKADLNALSEQFYQEILFRRKRNDIHAQVTEFEKKGYHIILASATLDFIAEMIAAKIGIRQFHATKLSYASNICTGRIETDLLGRKERVLKIYLEKFDEIVTVTDNKSDLALIKRSHSGIIITEEKDIQFWEKHAPENFRIVKVINKKML